MTLAICIVLLFGILVVVYSRESRVKKWGYRLLLAWLLLAVMFGVRLRGLRAQTTTHGVTLTWIASVVDSTHSAATSYNVLRGTATNTETFLATVQAPTTTYTDTTGTPGTKYFYEITASNSAGNSSVSNEVSATFLVPVTAPNPPVLQGATSN